MKVFEKAFWLAEVPEVHTTDDMGWGWCTPGLQREWAAVCHSCGRGGGACRVPRTAHLSRLGLTQRNPGPFQTCFFHIC